MNKLKIVKVKWVYLQSLRLQCEVMKLKMIMKICVSLILEIKYTGKKV